MPHPDSVRFILVLASFALLLGLVKRPFYGLLSYTIIMMTKPGLYYPILGKLRVELLVGILLIIILGFSLGKSSRIDLKNEPISKWTFMFVGIMLISTVQAFDLTTAWETLIEFLKVFIFFLIIITFTENEKDVKNFLWIFIIISCALGYEAVYNYMHAILQEGTGVRADYAIASKGMMAGHVGQANILVQALPFTWYLGICHKRTLEKVCGLVLFCLGLYGVLVSASRGGIIALVVMLGFFVIFSKHRAAMFFGGLSILACLVYSMGSEYQDYMGTILQGTSSGRSADSRVSGLRHGFEMLLKRPILGVGPGCYPKARSAWFGWSLWAHNHYGQLMGELGVLGTIVWFGFLQSYLRKAVNMLKMFEKEPERANLFKALIATSGVRLVLGMSAHSLYTFIWYLLAAILATSIWHSTYADQKVQDA